jgi:hypothetical protein
MFVGLGSAVTPDIFRRVEVGIHSVVEQHPPSTAPTPPAEHRLLLLGVTGELQTAAWWPEQYVAIGNSGAERFVAVSACSFKQWLRAVLSETRMRSVLCALDQQLREYRNRLDFDHRALAREAASLRQQFKKGQSAKSGTGCQCRLHSLLGQKSVVPDALWSSRGMTVCTRCACFASLYLPATTQENGQRVDLWSSRQLILLGPLVGLLRQGHGWCHWIETHILGPILATNLALLRAAPLFVGWISSAPRLESLILNRRLGSVWPEDPQIVSSILTLYPDTTAESWPLLIQLAHTGDTTYSDGVWEIVKQWGSFRCHAGRITRQSVLMRLIFMQTAIQRGNLSIKAHRPPPLTSMTSNGAMGVEIIVDSRACLITQSKLTAAYPYRRRIVVAATALQTVGDLDLVLPWTKKHDVHVVYVTPTWNYPDLFVHCLQPTPLTQLATQMIHDA